MPEEVRAIQCRSCGGAMYSDQKAAAYICAFCGTSVPWTNEQVFWASPITFRHKPVQIINGAMKLGHVEVMTEVDPHNERVLSQKYRQNSVAGKLERWDDTTAEAFAGVCQLAFVCPFCGGEFTGSRRSISSRAATAATHLRTSSSCVPACIDVSSSWVSARRMSRGR